jgi:hypothetical protein
MISIAKVESSLSYQNIFERHVSGASPMEIASLEEGGGYIRPSCAGWLVLSYGLALMTCNVTVHSAYHHCLSYWRTGVLSKCVAYNVSSHL